MRTRSSIFHCHCHSYCHRLINKMVTMLILQVLLVVFDDENIIISTVVAIAIALVNIVVVVVVMVCSRRIYDSFLRCVSIQIASSSSSSIAIERLKMTMMTMFVLWQKQPPHYLHTNRQLDHNDLMKDSIAY